MEDDQCKFYDVYNNTCVAGLRRSVLIRSLSLFRQIYGAPVAQPRKLADRFAFSPSQTVSDCRVDEIIKDLVDTPKLVHNAKGIAELHSGSSSIRKFVDIIWSY